MKEVYQSQENAGVVGDTLEEIVKEGGRRMLAAALSEEVNGFLGRVPYERSDEFRGYRNGWLVIHRPYMAHVCCLCRSGVLCDYSMYILAFRPL